MKLCPHYITLMPTCMGESPAKGTFPVASSQRMTAKLYMSAVRLSMSSGRCCRTGKGFVSYTTECTTFTTINDYCIYTCIYIYMYFMYSLKLSYTSSTKHTSLHWPITCSLWIEFWASKILATCVYIILPSGAIQLGRKNFSLSMNENRV